MNKVKKILVPILLPAYLKIYKFYTLYIVPFKYKEERYLDSFISKNKKDDTVQLENAKEVIYIFWTGHNDISENRLKGINSLRRLSGVEVVLITPENLDVYILDDYPLHPAYQYLSLIHKSDYLRCYFMLHHGGGYADIKPCLRSWKSLFNILNNSDNKWCISERERFVGGVPDIKGQIGIDMKKYHNNLITNCVFIYKPNSPILREWMEETHNRLDQLLLKLQENPGNQYGSADYPVPWSFIMAQIMHPLVLKYHERIICKDIQLYSTENYR
jgi:hypothetical protein